MGSKTLAIQQRLLEPINIYIDNFFNKLVLEISAPQHRVSHAKEFYAEPDFLNSYTSLNLGSPSGLINEIIKNPLGYLLKAPSGVDVI